MLTIIPDYLLAISLFSFRKIPMPSHNKCILLVTNVSNHTITAGTGPGVYIERQYMCYLVVS